MKRKSWQELLTLSPAEIQAYLDQRLADADPQVQAVILKVDYVEPGSVRDPSCQHYAKIGAYEGTREVVEVACQLQPGGATVAVEMILRLL